MALQRKKGYSIESKTARFKLLRDGIDLDETKNAFNDLVTFYFALCATHPPMTFKADEYYRVYEGFTLGENAQYPLPFDVPSVFRRCEGYKYGGKCYVTVTGYRGNSGLNAARNIGLKFLARRFGQPTLAVQRKVSIVEKAKPVKVGFDQVASKVSG